MGETLDTLSAALGRRLEADGSTLATAESCTGGWVSKVVTDVPGSSGWFDRGFVTYSNRAKEEMLGVSPQTLATYGAVSEPVVCEMALGALARSGAVIAVAVSGVAGPDGGTEEKPVGTVCFAWARRDATPLSQRFQFAGNRAEVRHQSVRVALERYLDQM